MVKIPSYLHIPLGIDKANLEQTLCVDGVCNRIPDNSVYNL